VAVVPVPAAVIVPAFVSGAALRRRSTKLVLANFKLRSVVRDVSGIALRRAVPTRQRCA
jgi:hypothetical protein